MRNPLHKKILARGTKATTLPGFLCGGNVSAVQISTGTLAHFATVQLPPRSCSQLPDLRPNILLGFASDFRRLLDLISDANVNLSVDRAVLSLTQSGDPPLADLLRDSLWATFGVPVYEVFLGATGDPLALECEAHEGWHIEPGVTATLSLQELIFEGKTGERFQTGMTGVILAEPCPCGRLGIRVTEVQELKAITRGQKLTSAAA